MKTSENIKGALILRTPFTDIFVSHQVYPWQVALQQSLLPFNLIKQK